MFFKNILPTLCLPILLAACGGGDVQRIEVSAKPIQIDIAKTADPEAVRINPVQWHVVNKENLDAFLAEMRKQQGTNNPVFIAITTKDYENLSLNLADLKRYIQQQQSVIVYYRNLTSHPEQPPAN
jgi:anion-transporting  ArsA/GET3 family ATPase